MKLMIASDIHGSSLYCEELLKRYNDEKPDKLCFWAIYCITARE